MNRIYKFFRRYQDAIVIATALACVVVGLGASQQRDEAMAARAAYQAQR